MLIFNTTYQADDEVANNFAIWIKECFIPEVEKTGDLKKPRLCKILSHRDEGVSFSLQWEVEDSTKLHRWHMEQGIKLNEELINVFKDKVVGSDCLRNS